MKVYHITPSKYWNFIQEEGLIVDSIKHGRIEEGEPGIPVFVDFDEARDAIEITFCDVFPDASSFLILEVEVDKKPKFNKEFEAYYINNDIDSEDIALVKRVAV